jgi:hypothetical protein
MGDIPTSLHEIIPDENYKFPSVPNIDNFFSSRRKYGTIRMIFKEEIV